MKKRYTVILIFLLTTLGKASGLGRAVELATSFKQAAALADAEDDVDAAVVYRHRELKPYWLKQYGPVFQSCLATTDHPDKSPFSFVMAIGKDGHVLRLYIDHETNIFTCARRTLERDEFPHPPLSPYYFQASMSFPK